MTRRSSDFDVRYFSTITQTQTRLISSIEFETTIESNFERVANNFTRPVSLRIDYTYIDNDSNTSNCLASASNDYQRHVLSTQLIFTLR